MGDGRFEDDAIRSVINRWAEKLRAAAGLEIPYPTRVALQGRASAVLVLFALETPSAGDSLSILLTQRSATLGKHPGQIAFPGGVLDADDEKCEGLRTTALRETEEEMGIDRNQIEVLGRLPDLCTLTGFVISPFLGILRAPHPEVSWQLSEGEIADALWVPVRKLRDPGVYHREKVEGTPFETDVYRVDHFRVWGATGAILKNILDRMDRLGLD